MRGAAFRLAAACAALVGAGAACAASSAIPTARIAGADYVPLPAAAAALGLRAGSSLLGRGFSLSGAGHRVELQAESSEALVDGLRVYLGDPTLLRNDRLYLSRTDYERCLLPLLRPDLIAGPVPPPLRVIAIDPGHGGPDHGTENPRLGMMEKTYTLETALLLAPLLEKAGYRVVLTRHADVAERLDLQIRDLIANQARADLFVSIHFNSLAPDTRTKGIELFTFPPEGQRATSDRTGSESQPSPVNRFDGWSELLAQEVHRDIHAAMATNDRGKKLEHLGVLRHLNCPGILIEGGFLSNDAEARRIASPAYRQQLAAAIAAGIGDYARQLDALRARRTTSPR